MEKRRERTALISGEIRESTGASLATDVPACISR